MTFKVTFTLFEAKTGKHTDMTVERFVQGPKALFESDRLTFEKTIKAWGDRHNELRSRKGASHMLWFEKCEPVKTIPAAIFAEYFVNK